MPHVRCNKRVEQILAIKTKATGRSRPELLEYALINMPYIPPKKFRRKNDVFQTEEME